MTPLSLLRFSSEVNLSLKWPEMHTLATVLNLSCSRPAPLSYPRQLPAVLHDFRQDRQQPTCFSLFLKLKDHDLISKYLSGSSLCCLMSCVPKRGKKFLSGSMTLNTDWPGCANLPAFTRSYLADTTSTLRFCLSAAPRGTGDWLITSCNILEPPRKKNNAVIFWC